MDTNSTLIAIADELTNTILAAIEQLEAAQRALAAIPAPSGPAALRSFALASLLEDLRLQLHQAADTADDATGAAYRLSE